MLLRMNIQGGPMSSAPASQPSPQKFFGTVNAYQHTAVLMTAQAIADVIEAKKGQPMKVLDIAAGHGVFGVTIAQQNPHAKIVAVDWKNVLEVSKETANKAGVGSRYSTIPGSAFDVDYGKD